MLTLIIFIAGCIGLYGIFAKAGIEPWKALIPFYNAYLLLQIAGKPAWWLLLFLIPLVNIFIFAIVGIELGKRFGKSVPYGLGLGLLGAVFMIHLAYFDDAKYSETADNGQAP